MHPRHTPIVLMALDKPRSFNEILRHTNMAPVFISKSLRILRNGGLVTTRPTTDEERGPFNLLWKYELTEKGRKKLPAARNYVKFYDEFWRRIKTRD